MHSKLEAYAFVAKPVRFHWPLWWSEIMFYGDDASAEPYNAICNHKTDKWPPQMTIFNTDPHSNALFHMSSFQNELLFTKVKLYQQHKTRCQPMKKTLRNDVGFPTVYHRILRYTVANFLYHPIRCCLIFVCALAYMPYLTLWDEISQKLAHLEANSHKIFQISQDFQTI